MTIIMIITARLANLNGAERVIWSEKHAEGLLPFIPTKCAEIAARAKSARAAEFWSGRDLVNGPQGVQATRKANEGQQLGHDIDQQGAIGADI